MRVQCNICGTQFELDGLTAPQCPSCPPGFPQKVMSMTHYYVCLNHDDDPDFVVDYLRDFTIAEPIPITMQIGVSAKRLNILRQAYEMGLYNPDETITMSETVKEIERIEI